MRALQFHSLVLTAAAATVAAASVLLVGQAHANEAAMQQLVEMTNAVRKTNYDGVVVYSSGQRMETMRIVHGFDGQRERERLVSMTGDPREIVRDGDSVICVLPKQRAKMIDEGRPESLLPAVPLDALARLSNFYTVTDLGAGRVADRRCRGIAVQPKDSYRYGYRIWLDEAHQIPLKVSLVDGDGNVLEQMLFTQVIFPDAIAPEAFEPQIDTEGFETIRHQVAADAAPVPASAWGIDDLPPGFRVAAEDTRPLGDAASPVNHLLLTDGLATVSVFAARNALPDQVFEGISSLGAVNAYGRMVGTQHIAVVGEVPARTVELIGNSLRPPGEQLPQ
ncbi:hypothetical protein GYB61_05330 [bacterium]|nr:hypothetical protein [bacterium]